MRLDEQLCEAGLAPSAVFRVGDPPPKGGWELQRCTIYLIICYDAWSVDCGQTGRPYDHDPQIVVQVPNASHGAETLGAPT